MTSLSMKLPATAVLLGPTVFKLCAFLLPTACYLLSTLSSAFLLSTAYCLLSTLPATLFLFTKATGCNMATFKFEALDTAGTEVKDSVQGTE